MRRIPKYPVYVISKGRWEQRLTVRALQEMLCPFHVVIEPQEYTQYSAVIAEANILTLPFSNLGLGSIPARNWVWDHARESGADRHWILDDNISGFVRLNNNLKVPVTTAAIFRVAEEFVDRYENIAIAGLQYRFLGGSARSKQAPFSLNQRIYSCLLIKNDIPYHWRGRYNEDTDLSIRVLRDGWVTCMFNIFRINKAATMTCKGGNTEELYKEDGRLKMAQSLQAQHPDIVKISWKWDRWQHQVDYSQFRNNQLKLKSGIRIKDEIDNFGMILQTST